MKKTLLGAMCALILSLPTMASVNGPFIPLTQKFSGTFLKEKTIYFANYIDRESCESDGGTYQPEGYCVFDSADEVKVKKTSSTAYEVEISTIGTNGHSCLYIGDAQPITSHTLLSTVATEAYNDETGKWEKTTCQLTLEFKGNYVSVDTNGKCREFCGARAQLLIDEALRQ